MIALLALYALAVGGACAAAAWLVERAALVVRRPTRWVWVAALAASVALPARAALRAVAAPAARDAVRVPLALPTGVASVAPVAPAPGRASRLPSTLAPPAAWSRLDRPLAAAWAALAAAAALRLAAAGARARRAVRRFPRREVLDTRVRVSDGLGPAVAGAARPEIVVPGWALVDPRLPMMLAHERAHVRARDPLLSRPRTRPRRWSPGTRPRGGCSAACARRSRSTATAGCWPRPRPTCVPTRPSCSTWPRARSAPCPCWP
jgi:beta-lactamase regulating signal transducer with metallopeptidase domain